MAEPGGLAIVDRSAFAADPVRGVRQENLNFGREFSIKERFRVSIRMEFINIFNRMYLNNPYIANPLVPQTKSPATGVATGGWGYINTGLPGTSFYRPAARHPHRALPVLTRVGHMVLLASFA